MSDENFVSVTTESGFSFGHVPIDDNLTATEYMIGMIAVDHSGSVNDSLRDIEQCLIDITEMNKKLPNKNNIMQRVTMFSYDVQELSPLQPVNNIDSSKFKNSIPSGGMTALYDATMDAIESSEKFCKDMIDADYDVTACIFIITDGWDNVSKKCTSMAKIKQKIEQINSEENYSSPPAVILIGITNNSATATKLNTFSRDAGFTNYIEIKDASPSLLGKLAGLISQSFSSKSQNITSSHINQQLSQITI